MIDRRRAVDPQTALIQAEGELRLKPSPHRKTPPQGLLDPNHKALGKILSHYHGVQCAKLAAHLAARK